MRRIFGVDRGKAMARWVIFRVVGARGTHGRFPVRISMAIPGQPSSTRFLSDSEGNLDPGRQERLAFEIASSGRCNETMHLTVSICYTPLSGGHQGCP
jgi:hypothetical protein